MKNVKYPYQQIYYQKHQEQIKAKQKLYPEKKKQELSYLSGRKNIICGFSVASAVVSPMVLMWAFPKYSWNIFATFLTVTLFLLIFLVVMVFSLSRESN